MTYPAIFIPQIAVQVCLKGMSGIPVIIVHRLHKSMTGIRHDRPERVNISLLPFNAYLSPFNASPLPFNVTLSPLTPIFTS